MSSHYTPHGVRQTGLDEVWDDLHQGMRHVYQHQGMSKQRYIGLYTYPFLSVNSEMYIII